MVSTTVFVIAVSLLSTLVFVLLFSTSFLYLKLRSLVPSGTPSPAPPLLSTVQNPTLRPPNHHLATSDAYSNLDFAQLPFSRPPSFLQVNPSAQRLGVTDSPFDSSPTTKRISIATTISRNGSRVLTRNSSTQDSHERRKSAASERKAGLLDSTVVVLARTKRNRKSFGVGNEEVTIEVEDEGERRQLRRRSSTWTTEDLGQLVEATDAFAPSDLDIRAAKRSSLLRTQQRLSLEIRPEALPLSSLPGQVYYDRSMAAQDDGSERAQVESSPLPDNSNHVRLSPDRHPQSALLHLHDPRFSASYQALFDLETYAADLSQPCTPSFSPRPLSSEQNLRLDHPLQFGSLLTANRNSLQRGPDDGGGGGDSIPDSRMEINSNHRPSSWLKRQGSSGTLPEQIFDHARLAIANPDESRASTSTLRDSFE
ncbi:hypothetical protein JCM3765_003025 [Sporobolomyces pararoseus]